MIFRISIIVLVFSSFCSKLLNAQDVKLTYYDVYGNVIVADMGRLSENVHTYTLTAVVGDEIVIERYGKSEALDFKGHLSVGDSLRTGLFYFYNYDDSSLKEITNYKNGKREGISTLYSSGKIISRREFKNNFLHGEVTQFYPDGISIYKKVNYLNDAGLVEKIIREDTAAVNYLLPFVNKKYKKQSGFSLAQKIERIKGIPDGENYYYHKNGQIASKELFNQGRLVLAEYFDSLGTSRCTFTNPYEFVETEINQNIIDKFLLSNFRFPATYEKDPIYGKMIVGIIVNEEGKVIKAEILKSLEETLDAELLRVVLKKTDVFRAPKFHNISFERKFTIPFTILRPKNSSLY